MEILLDLEQTTILWISELGTKKQGLIHRD